MSFYPKNVVTIAPDNETAARFNEGAKTLGMNVTRTDVYSGPVPEGSFVRINEFTQMATPEFMFLHKANELPHDEAIMCCCALLVPYNTRYTTSSLKGNETKRRDEPHTTAFDLLAYLMQVIGTPEGNRAIAILDESLQYVDAFESICEVRCEAADAGRPCYL